MCGPGEPGFFQGGSEGYIYRVRDLIFAHLYDHNKKNCRARVGGRTRPLRRMVSEMHKNGRAVSSPKAGERLKIFLLPIQSNFFVKLEKF